MDMPYRMYHTLYKAAWSESVAKAKEAEEAEKEAAKAEKLQKKKSSMTPRDAAISSIRGMSSDDLEEFAEEAGLA